MPQSKQVDAYIAQSAEFAKPILIHLRKLVHQVCPDANEVIKWGFSNFEYKGLMCNMAAFKQHCAFGFWKASLIRDPKKLLQSTDKGSMGNFDRITLLKDLPSDKILSGFIKQAMELNEKGAKRKVSITPKGSKTIETPAYFIRALKKNKKAEAIFEKFAYSHRKEYIQWFEEAKTEATRAKRIAQAIEWIAEGKGRNWQYAKK
ncbi:MAG: YdeI/OmpD-associated family protein [Bacteroidetes bacterium]|nr:YdeI/OmpD-associated family protein [Bacteroidota bacterium]MBS1539018.1 YdeI/OmpD-associated family protein [Bacteroidota bacterium]